MPSIAADAPHYRGATLETRGRDKHGGSRHEKWRRGKSSFKGWACWRRKAAALGEPQTALARAIMNIAYGGGALAAWAETGRCCA